MKILSFNSYFEGDMNRSCAARRPSEADRSAIAGADAVILPRGCKQSLYIMARRNCPNVFPNYDVCYRYPGKTGQINLFRENNLLHPESKIFHDCSEFLRIYSKSPFSFPCVFKFSWGGEGRYVYLLKTHGDFLNCMEIAGYWEKKGFKGFLFQEYIPTGGRSLRAVVMGRHIFTYWRAQKDREQFYTNLVKGAFIDNDSDMHLQNKAMKATRCFSKKTGLNHAGLDFLFTIEEADPEPLFLEINYFFHYTGLGGPDSYRLLLRSAVEDWLSHIA